MNPDKAKAAAPIVAGPAPSPNSRTNQYVNTPASNKRSAALQPQKLSLGHK